MSTKIQEKINTYLEETGLSVAAFERQAGLKMNVIRNIIKGQSRRPTAETLQAVATAMGCTVADLLGVKASQEFHRKIPSDNSPAIQSKEMLATAFQTVMNSIEEVENQPTLRQTLTLVEEVYLYSLKKEPPSVDKDFVKWLIEKSIS